MKSLQGLLDYLKEDGFSNKELKAVEAGWNAHKEQAPCQHQWATTLLYIPEGSKDRNITKCMKCGIEQAPTEIDSFEKWKFGRLRLVTCIENPCCEIKDAWNACKEHYEQQVRELEKKHEMAVDEAHTLRNDNAKLKEEVDERTRTAETLRDMVEQLKGEVNRAREILVNVLAEDSEYLAWQTKKDIEQFLAGK